VRVETLHARKVEVRSMTLHPVEHEGELVAPLDRPLVEVDPASLVVCIPVDAQAAGVDGAGGVATIGGGEQPVSGRVRHVGPVAPFAGTPTQHTMLSTARRATMKEQGCT
jgi:hypothetical protein